MIVRVDDCTTKTEVLSQIAKVYDPLELVSLAMLAAKLLYRDIYDAKIAGRRIIVVPLKALENLEELADRGCRSSVTISRGPGKS